MRSSRAWAASVRAAAAGLAIAAMAGTAAAQEGAPAAAPSITWRVSFKSSALVAQAPADAVLGPGEASATGFWRARVEPTLHFGSDVSFSVAYEQRLRVPSSDSLGGAVVLPAEIQAPYRVRQFDWPLATPAQASWWHEIDRAALNVRLEGPSLTVGRQAIGWGRGLLFGALDLFSPFTPLEADREWRRGVDAARVDVPLSSRTSVDAVAVLGRTMSESAFAARFRGYAGRADLEIAGGRRGQDGFVGGSTSMALAGAELHGEAAVFRTPANPGSVAFGEARTIAKIVAGGSYRLPIGPGVPLAVEYHYSGFGAANVAGLATELMDPGFVARYLRGDTQLLGRHAVAVSASFEPSPFWNASLQWLQGPRDSSGVVTPSVTLTWTDRFSTQMIGYLPYGAAPTGGVLRTEFGASPIGLFVQARYDR